MADRVRLKHSAITLVVSILLVAAVGALIYAKEQQAYESMRTSMLSDPEYAASPARALIERESAGEHRRVVFATAGMLTLLAIWLCLSTLIQTRELAGQLRKLRQAIREVSGGQPASGEDIFERESSIPKLLSAIHAQANALKESGGWAPTPSMVMRVEVASGKGRFLPSNFVWRWAFLALVVFLGTQAVPILIWHLQTWRDVGVAAAGWFVGGFLVAAITPGRTVLEPAVGALFAAQATLVYLLFNTEMQGGLVSEYLLGTVAGFLLALVGALAGEAFQSLFTKGGKKTVRIQPLNK